MKIQKDFCDICKEYSTDTKCDICKRFICYGEDNKKKDKVSNKFCVFSGCLKSWGFGFNNNVFCGLNLCPDCEKKVKRRLNIKYGSQKDIKFLKEMENKMRDYIIDRFKLNTDEYRF